MNRQDEDRRAEHARYHSTPVALMTELTCLVVLAFRFGWPTALALFVMMEATVG